MTTMHLAHCDEPRAQGVSASNLRGMEGERREPDQGMSASSDERAQRALSFGQVAELYNQWCPGYPDALYADVLEFGPGEPGA